ncbi:hypothetical protein BDD12DRAFT_821584 [Trichophaea hybrida]|nr:hypothetical protein BDD12DRAFT_821584 [Trichophaea hybrida]
MASISTIAPAYGPDYRDASRSSLSIVRPGHGHHHAPVVDETVIEHEHHHLHHHIDHGDVSSRLALARVERPRSRPGLGREYSYDDLDLRERRYANGAAVTSISHSHDHSPRGSHRHRHRHRSRRGSVERTRYSRSEIDLAVDYSRDNRLIDDDLTVIDVPAGTRRVYVNVEKGRRDHSSVDINWRRERGVRRSRGLGNELWTEITKDLVTREAIEDLGYPFEETDYFYYIFEFLGKDQIAELRELTDGIRHERVRDIEYESIAGSQYGVDRMDRMIDDSRTEIIIEGGHNRDRERHQRRYYYT